MTGRQIIAANLNQSGAPRPGLNFDRGRRNDMMFASAGPPSGYTQRRWTQGNREFYDDIWGNIWVRMIGGSIKGEIHTPVLEDWSQLDRFEPPRYDVEATASRIRAGFDAGIREDEARGVERYRVAGIGGWVFDNARYLRKLEVYLMDMALYPEELRRVHTMVAGVYEALILAAGKAGADAIMIGEDMGTQTGLLFSPAMFRDYFKADYTRLMGLAHELGMKVLMHSCGSNREILDDLIDCGVDAFQFDQPTVYDMDELAALFRRRTVALYSPIDIQAILPTGDHELITEGARRMCRTFAGCLIAKNYGDLPGIGVTEEWDDWAYEAVLEFAR